MKLLALLNGDIWTMDERKPKCQGVLIRDNKIECVGENYKILEESKKLGVPEVVDLRGKTVLPGFIDSHLHMTWYARTLLQVDCSYARSILDIVTLLKKKPTEFDGWIQGFGYDDNKLREKRHPTRYELDTVSHEKPVILFHVSGHMVTVNSKALEIAGITEDTPDPHDGRIDRDGNGLPTGLLLEGAQGLAISKIPPYSINEIITGLQLASENFLKKGITSIHDPGVGEFGPEEAKAYEKMYREGTLKTRVNIFFPLNKMKDIENALSDPASCFNRIAQIKSDWLRLGGVKLYVDGSLIGQTAAVYLPYRKDKRQCGMLFYSPEELERIVEFVHRKGFQVAIHAIGERAVDICLKAYLNAQNNYPRKDCRHRIEHCGMISKENMRLMKDLEVLAVSQPYFIYDFGDGFSENLEKSEHKKVYAFKSIAEEGIPLAFSSDAPVSNFDPIAGIKAAVRRITLSGKLFEGQERISLYQAIRGYTVGGAFASFEENKKGKVLPGYLADMVILSGCLEKDAIEDIHVEKTILNGNMVNV